MTEIDCFHSDLIRFLAIPAEDQVAYVGDKVPEASSRNPLEIPEGVNLLVETLRLILDVSPSIELEGDDAILSELLEILTLMLESSNPRIFSRTGLKEYVVWRTLRKLAIAWLASVRVDVRTPRRPFYELVA